MQDKGYPKFEKIELDSQMPLFSFRVLVYLKDWTLPQDSKAVYHQLKYRILGQDFFIDLGEKPGKVEVFKVHQYYTKYPL